MYPPCLNFKRPQFDRYPIHVRLYILQRLFQQITFLIIRQPPFRLQEERYPFPAAFMNPQDDPIAILRGFHRIHNHIIRFPTEHPDAGGSGPVSYTHLGIIWAVAGFNILRIGILSYRGNVTLLNLFLSCVIFAAFWFLVFDKLVRKHTFRILNYQEEKQFFLKFFDIKSFCIMAFMMTFGIGLRVSGLCPDLFIAVFYTGLGTALFLAGASFASNYFQALRTDVYKRQFSYLYCLLCIRYRNAVIHAASGMAERTGRSLYPNYRPDG